MKTPDSNNMKLSITDIKRFFQVLSDNENEIFTGWFCDKEGEKPLEGLGTVIGPAKKFIKAAKKVSSECEGTLHIVLNRTSDKGRKIKDVQSVRVLCLDLDEKTEKQKLQVFLQEYQPDLIVESSPSKFHIYWRITGELPLELWQQYQLGLAHKLGGDKNLCQVNHSIRVPGIQRYLKDHVSTFNPRVVYMADFTGESRMSNTDILNKFPWIISAYEEAKKEEEKRRKALKKVLRTGKVGEKEGHRLAESRNRTIFDYVLESIVKNNGALKEGDAIELGHEMNGLFPVNGKPPLEAREIEKAARSAFRYGQEILDAEREKFKAGISDSTNQCEFRYDYTDKHLRDNRFTETSVAARVFQRFGSKILRVKRAVYVFDEGRKVWVLQTRECHPELYSFAQEGILDTLRDEKFLEVMCVDSKGKPSLQAKRNAEDRFLRIGLAGRVVDAITHWPKLKRETHSIFDADEKILFCGNGALDMVTGELREPVAEDYLLNKTPILWDENAECREWKKFLSEVFSENEEPERMVLFMQELFGYSLSGFINAQKLFCHFGDGCNGKSKVLWALSYIMGDYATYIDPDDIVSKKNAPMKAMERIGAKIEGHRLVVVDDISTQTVWNEAFVKNLTAPVIRARAEYEQSREFSNRAAVHLGLNQAPNPEDENEGILRRVCLIPYMKQFSHSGTKSDEIDSMIKREASGILRWAVEGFQRYMGRGGQLKMPNELTAAAQEYKQEYFKGETIVTDLFEVDRSGGFEFLSQIVTDINNYVRETGSGNILTPEDVAKSLKRTFKIKCIKKWDNEKKNMFRAFNVKLKFERKVKKDNYSNLL